MIRIDELRRLLAEDAGPHQNAFHKSECRMALHTALRESIHQLLDVYEAAVRWRDANLSASRNRRGEE